MELAAYHELARVEDAHWWHRGRREVLRAVLRRFLPQRPVRLIEIGCGTGGNLLVLKEFGSVIGVEASAIALNYSRSRQLAPVHEGSLPDRIALPAASGDCICLLDVLEHVEDDVAALAACKRLLAPGGRVLVTVPAYRWLWSAHDEHHHHRRRYTRQTLLRCAADAGLAPDFVSHFNAWLLPLAIAARVKDRLLPTAAATGARVPPGWLNKLLFRIFASEAALLRRVSLPVGLSLCGVFTKASHA